MTRAGICILLACCGVAAQPPRARGQQPDKDHPYTLRRSVRRVVLDIVVTDKEGRFVPGLSRREFTVLENRKRERILSFDEEDFRSGPSSLPRQQPVLPPGTFTNMPAQREAGPLYVIVYDLRDTGYCYTVTHCDLSNQMFARQQLARFLAVAPAGARFALFTVAEDCHLVQGFTSDREQLLRSLDVARKRGAIPWVFLYQAEYPSEPWQVLAFIGHWLEGLPGRKNLIWLANAFPASFDLPPDMQGGTRDLGGGYKPAPGTMGSSFEAKTIREAIDALNRAQVSLYPIDVSGVGGEDLNAELAAKVTGGHAWSSTNDVAGALQQAVASGGSYYEVSYDPGDLADDGKMRTIQVELRNRAYEASYRKFYYADAADAPLTNEEKRNAAAVADQIAAHRAGDTMYAWMRHGAPDGHGILFRAHFSAGPEALASEQQMAALVEQPAYFVARKANRPAKPREAIPLRTYTIDYLVLDQAAAGLPPPSKVLEFAACAYDGDGTMLNGVAQEAVRTESASREWKGRKGLFHAIQTLEVPETAQWLRVAVRDVETDRVGTIEVALPLAGQRAAAASQ